MAIDKINGQLLSFYNKINGILLANIASINGISLGGAPPVTGTDVTIDDLTYGCFPNPTWTTTTPLTFNLPATAKEGDVCFLFVESDGIFNGQYIATPTGWTKHFGWYGSTSDNEAILCTKILDASDITAGTVDVYSTYSAYNRDGQGWTWLGGNVNPLDPVSDVGVWTQSVGTSKTIAGITPTKNGLNMAFWGFDGGDGEPTTLSSGSGVTPWTKDAEQDCDSTSGGTFAGFASKASSAGTATGDLIVTALLSDGWGGVQANVTQATLFPTNLEHNYRVDAYSGTGNFLDAQGNSDLVLNGPTYVNTGTKHFSFDGINDYAVGNSSYVYNTGEDFSFGIWARWDDVTGVQLTGGTNDSSLSGNSIFINGNLFWRIRDNNGNFFNANSSFAPSTNTWYYLGYSYTYSSNTLSGWIGDNNGFRQVLTSVTATGVSPVTAQFPIVYGAQTYWHKGDLGDFNIYRGNIAGQGHLNNWAYYKKYYGY